MTHDDDQLVSQSPTFIQTPFQQGRADTFPLPGWKHGYRRKCQCLETPTFILDLHRAEGGVADDLALCLGYCGKGQCTRAAQGVHQSGFVYPAESSGLDHADSFNVGRRFAAARW